MEKSMRLYMVSYDLLKRGQNYAGIIAKLRTYPAHWHVQESVWVIGSDQSAAQIRDELSSIIDDNDKLIVARLQGEAAWYGYDANASAWFKSRLQQAA
jgi:lysine/ornithine N-monooxygenase